MKKICNSFLLIVFAVCLATLSSCTNLDDIKNRLNDHEKRLNNLESLVKTANENIQLLQTLVDAQSKKLSIVSHEPTADGTGYVLTMSDGSKITLKNGSDGTSPAIGVKKADDGHLYWTLNGEFMLDAHGEKIKAEGVDGAAGVTPQMRVDVEGYWEVSTDGGKTWQQVLGVDGKPVKAVGTDATTDLKITEEDGKIIIVFNGQTFIIPLAGGSEGEPVPYVKLPIEYMAEYNINPEGTGFVTTHANNVSGYFTFKQAQTQFSSIAIDGKNYHLPSIDEWRGIINDKCISFKERMIINGKEESIQMGKSGAVKVYLADYKSPEDYLAYGLRFAGVDGDNSMLSAWRYECIQDPNSTDAKAKLIVITVRLLGEKFTGKVSDIANPAFWEKDNARDIVRYIPQSGWVNADEIENEKGTSARFFSSTITSGSYPWYVYLTGYSLGLMDTMDDWYYDLSDRYTVRLFED